MSARSTAETPYPARPQRHGHSKQPAARLLPLLAAAIAWLAPAPTHAQTVTLDEGTFRILVEGTEVGLETFSIRQNGTGNDAVVIARGRVILDAGRGGQEVQASLQYAGPALRPAAYDLEVRGPQAQRIAARVAGSRVSARIAGAGGEQMREYLLSDGAVLLDEALAHHYYFAARRAGGRAGSIPVVLPRSSRQVQARVDVAGSESVVIAGTSQEATRYTITLSGGSAVNVWTDARGRVLRLEDPGRSYVAIRTAAPASRAP